jgi:hypothetical protein
MLALTIPTAPANAQTEEVFVSRYCAGMAVDIRLPDGTRPDCVSATHAIEVDYSEKWAEAIGQALHYAQWTRETTWLTGPKQPGIVLVCRLPRETCTNHVGRIVRIVRVYRLPITIWDCDMDEMRLRECQIIEP